MTMNIVKTQNKEKTTIILTGRLDTTTAPQLQAELIPELEASNEVVLDFADLV